MSVRSFTVFQDAPSDSPPSHKDSDVRALTLSATDAAATLLSTLAAIEKENLHPLTGQRAGPPVGSEAKKRKTSALATKVLIAPSSKKHKELKGEQKKTRKPLGSVGKPKSSDARKSSSKQSRSSRKPSPLPPVAEEQELQRRPARLSINVDSRCYELTVSPLADVSEAYDATRMESQEPDAHTESDKSVGPVVRNYIAPFVADGSLQVNDAPCDIDGSSCQTNPLSTPERKRVNSAFTFSSPSPTSKRFKQVHSSPTSRASPTSSFE